MVCHEWTSMMQVFANVWSAAPQAQASLRKLLATWTNIFPEAVLAAVASHIGGPAVSVLPQPPLGACTLVLSAWLPWPKSEILDFRQRCVPTACHLDEVVLEVLTSPDRLGSMGWQHPCVELGCAEVSAFRSVTDVYVLLPCCRATRSKHCTLQQACRLS